MLGSNYLLNELIG